MPKTTARPDLIAQLRAERDALTERIKELEADRGACPHCGGPVHWKGMARKPTYCSPRCRWAAYHLRRTGRGQETPPAEGSD